MFSPASLILALAASGSAHMIMGTPKPFQFEDTSTEQAPLTLADFPCKQPGGTYASNGVTQWPVGTKQDVSFIGSATHGGGSCQFSITTDAKPTKQSQWKVIESVVGGCVTNATGNFAADANAVGDAAVFPVTMPTNIPSGTYTFAWTWLNKVGNREFYMNCAPIQVTGGSGTKDALNTLPDMWVSNLQTTPGCDTSAYQDFQYPNPGSVVVNGPNAAPGSKFDSTAGCAAVTTLGSGNGQMGSPSQPTGYPAQASGSQPAQSPAQATQPASNPQASTPSGTKKPGVFAPGASSAPAASAPAESAPAATVPAPAASAPAASAPAPAQPNASYTPQSPDNTNSSSSDCTPCTNDGAVVCIGSSQFGLCNRGCAVAQDLAAGMACSNGQIVGATKRHIHFPRAHLHRRHGSSLL